jgi:hypothetical protein
MLDILGHSEESRWRTDMLAVTSARVTCEILLAWEIKSWRMNLRYP